MTDSGKRAISFGLFGIGGLAGLFGCMTAPAAIFVIGLNDSPPEILALLLPLTLLPTCVIALWWPRRASVWLLLLALDWASGLTWQRSYLFAVRHFPIESLGTLLGREMVPAYFVAGLGLFGLLTSQADSPRLLGYSEALDT